MTQVLRNFRLWLLDRLDVPTRAEMVTASVNVLETIGEQRDGDHAATQAALDATYRQLEARLVEALQLTTKSIEVTRAKLEVLHDRIARLEDRTAGVPEVLNEWAEHTSQLTERAAFLGKMTETLAARDETQTAALRTIAAQTRELAERVHALNRRLLFYEVAAPNLRALKRVLDKREASARATGEMLRTAAALETAPEPVEGDPLVGTILPESSAEPRT